MRRLDRVLGPEFCAGLDRLGLDEVRSRRQQAQLEEGDLSYVRRLLQGRIDILRTALGSADPGDSGEAVLGRLPEILADPPPTRSTSARHLRLGGAGASGEYREEMELLLADVSLSDPAHRPPAELGETLGALEAYEAEVSRYRREVQQVVDRFGVELTRRYREGEARVDDLLAAEQRDAD